jgi:hypothetical protein
MSEYRRPDPPGLEVPHAISVRDRLDGAELPRLQPEEALHPLDGITRKATHLGFDLFAVLSDRGFRVEDYWVDIEITIVPKPPPPPQATRRWRRLG